MRILGIDPGSRLTGYGCVDLVGNQIVHLCHGTLELMPKTKKSDTKKYTENDDTVERRLAKLHSGIMQVIGEWKPEVVAIENIFFAKNAISALKLGQARGVALLCAGISGLKVHSYSATEVKKTLVGHGRADKTQVAQMVSILSGQKDFPTLDASDALALAICHAHHSLGPLRPDLGRRRKSRGTIADAIGIKP